MQTAAHLALYAWRNDDVFDLPIRVRGVDLSSVGLAMDIRFAPDTPGAALIALSKIDNASPAEGLRVASVATIDGVITSELRIRIFKTTLRDLPYSGEIGDATPLAYALLIGGRTRLYGDFEVLAHAYGSDAAPANRPLSFGRASKGAASGGTTLTISADDGATITLDGADLIGPLVSDAQAAAAEAIATAELLNIVAEPIANVLFSFEDKSGRWWFDLMADGSMRMAKPADSQGNRLDLAIAANAAAIAAAEARQALQPPIQRQRLKRALYDGGLATPSVYAVDPVNVAPYTSVSSITGGSVIAKDDARLRFIAGKVLPGVGFPSFLAMWGQSTTNGNPAVLGGNGLPNSRYANSGGVEFVLPAGVNSFEVRYLGNIGQRVSIEIDGVLTNMGGYTFGPNNTGGELFSLVALPVSAAARRLRIWIRYPFAGLVLPPGGTILPSSPAVPVNVVFVGHSVTEGAVATTMPAYWAMQAAKRLGWDNPIPSGVGSSGYLKRNPASTGYTFRDRFASDVLTAVNGGPPDALVVAGGINDSSVVAGGPFTAEQIGAEALLYFQAARAAVPDMPIFALGPWTDYNNPNYSPTLSAARDAIFAAAAQVRNVHPIDVSDIVTSANRGTVFDGELNGPHPLDAGHAIYGQAVAVKIAAVIQTF